ncbi:MAG: class I SAM-dependent methyltransferase [Microbacterium sp.]|uniref:class I SAM-dependent methyltransferase n=1 Tax=Microbacterium sp. TaxID=51671 RepID=UPI003D6F16A2
MPSRLESEREFHDRAFGEGTRAPVWKYYEIQRYDNEHYRRLVMRYGQGKVLEYGCGTGSAAYLLARAGASVTGIDLSEVAIRQAQEEAERQGLSDRCSFQVMNAEELAFPADSFDLVCGTAILHHLELERAYREVARTMKPDGHGVFFEPLGHNPIINAYRRRTPQHRTPDEHPLLQSDIELAGGYFNRVETSYFHLATLAAVPFRGRRGFDGLLRALHGLDEALFRIPLLRRQAWMVIVTLTEPRSDPD